MQLDSIEIAVLKAVNKIELEVKQKQAEGWITEEQARRRVATAKKVARYLLTGVKEGTSEE